MVGNPGRSSLVTLMLVGTTLASCTLNELHRQEQSDRQRVEDKQAMAAGEESRARELAQQRQVLTADLTSRQLSLDEIRSRLARLLANNGALREQQDRLLAQRAQWLEQVHALNTELAALHSRSGPGDAERKARIQFLKQQLDQQLDLLLH